MSNEYNIIIAEGCIDAIDLIEQKKLSEFTDIITDIIDAKLDQMAEDYDLTEDEMLDEEQKRIKKFDSTHHVRIKLSCGPGKKAVNGVCKVIDNKQKMNMRRGSLKRKKTIRGLGKGAADKKAKKANKAKKFRKQSGL